MTPIKPKSEILNQLQYAFFDKYPPALEKSYLSEDERYEMEILISEERESAREERKRRFENDED